MKVSTNRALVLVSGDIYTQKVIFSMQENLKMVLEVGLVTSEGHLLVIQVNLKTTKGMGLVIRPSEQQELTLVSLNWTPDMAQALKLAMMMILNIGASGRMINPMGQACSEPMDPNKQHSLIEESFWIQLMNRRTKE